jgi:TrmH family RNA methyltransferase
MKHLPMQRITSKENRTFRRALAVRSGRPDDGDEPLVLLEGLRLCEEALVSRCDAKVLFLSEGTADAPDADRLRGSLPGDAEAVVLSDALFPRLCATSAPQGYVLLCASPVVQGLPDRADPAGRYLVLEDVRDPGNVGTMVRTADAAGLSGVVLVSGCADPFNDKALRASMGSVFHLPLYKAPLPVVAAWLRSAGLPLVAAVLDGPDLLDRTLPGKGAVLVGNEANGLSSEAVALSDVRTRIPMPGRAESLNAAAAAAVLVYEMLKASRRGD